MNLQGQGGFVQLPDGTRLPLESWEVGSAPPPPSLEDVLWSSFEEDPFGLAACALADWLEEQDDQTVADAVRWMRTFRRRPYRCSNGSRGWFDEVRWDDAEDPVSNLPREVFLLLKGEGSKWDVWTKRYYEGFRGAVRDLAQALGRPKEGGG